MIDNPKAPRVRRIAALARKKERLESQRFLVEGPQAVRELLLHRPASAEVIYTTAGSEEWQRELERLANASSVPIELVSEAVLAAMAETVTPQGVVAVARIAQAAAEEALRGARLVAILFEVRDPGNAGTVLRAADAAGADAVIFAGDCVDPWHPKVVRSTTGSLFHLPVLTLQSLDSAIALVRDAGLSVLAADVHGDPLTTVTATLAGPVAWVFGNEARGLTPEQRGLADRAVTLPIYGRAESLNLATAASVCLYTTAFAQRAEMSLTSR